MNYKLRIILTFVFSSLLFVGGAILKIMNLPFANVLFIIGQIMMVIAFVYILIKWTKKPSVNNSHTN
jgi:ABC-type uncharacterized transport system permease subunit